jgi:hypothetical protein
LKIFEIGKKKISIKGKRFAVSTNPERHLAAILKM